MMHHPRQYIDQFRDAGADHITVYYEGCPHLHHVLAKIKESGALAGVAINPHTSVNLLDDILEMTDIVLLMSVNPGYGGQKFIYRTIHKVEQLREKIITRNLSTLIEIDGGVGLQHAEVVLKAGANVLVAGSSIFKSAHPSDTISRMKAIGRENFMA